MSLAFLVFALMETTFQYLKYDTAEFRVPNKKPITLEEFHNRVLAGEALVILDDMVLDVAKFQWEHPGGTWSIKNNIGNDISKYFYGGFTMENKDFYPWTHSNDARRLCNLICLGYIEESSPERVMRI